MNISQNISFLKNKLCFFLIYDINDLNIKDFIENKINILHKRYENSVCIMSLDSVYNNFKINKEEQLFIFKNIFKIKKKDIPICLFFYNIENLECGIYSLANIDSNSINNIFESTIKEILLSENREDKKSREEIFNKFYSNNSDLSKYMTLTGSNSIDYYLGRYIVKGEIATLFEDISSIYKKMIVLKQDINKKALSRYNEPSSIESNNEIEEMYYRLDEELISLSNDLIKKNDKITEIIKNIYEQESLNLITKNLYSISDKLPCFKRYCVLEESLDKDILTKLENIRRRDNKNYNYVNYKDCFEKKSLKMIKTCELMEELIKNQPILYDSDIDFSVCASGYWKAIEIELNIIFIDTIRKDKHLINSIPSQGISNKKGKYEVFAGYKYYNNKKLTKTIDINKVDKGKLCTCMFGEIISICDHYNENELGEIIYNLYSMIDKEKYLEMDHESINNEIYLFMNSIINETKEVVYKYRNKYSHTGIMTDKDLKELKQLLLKRTGLYSKIGLLKNQVIKIK